MNKPLDIIDIILHVLGGFFLGITATMLFEFTQNTLNFDPIAALFVAIVFFSTALGILREAAQYNKSDLMDALLNIRYWSVQSHLEWIAWPIGTALVYLLWNII